MRSEEAIPGAELHEARAEIERLDREIVNLIRHRTRLARAAGDAKAAAGQPVLDPRQEAAVVRRAARLARDHDLPEEEVRRIFWHLVALSRQAQEPASTGSP